MSINTEMAGKVAIVTGAASGIGLGIANLLAERGAIVIAEDINPAVNDLKSDKIHPFVGDVSTEAAAVGVVKLAVESYGKLDILVNNAARIMMKPAIDTSLAEWNAILGVNINGPFLHSREAMKAMIPNKSGAIVNIATYAAFHGFATLAPYCASKGALIQLTRTLALEGIPHGIRVNAVGSGDVVTNIWDGKLENGREFLADHGKVSPIGRAADPREIAESVAYLASDRASYVVGAIFMTDGGMSVKVG